MNTSKTLILSAFLLLISFSLLAQNQMALIPVNSNGIEEISRSTFEQLLKQEIIKNTSYNIISQELTAEVAGDNYCMDADCASDIGKELNVDKVVSCSLSKLGRKIVIQFMKVDVQSKNVDIMDSVISSTIEDLEAVSKRIALSIAYDKKIIETAQVGAITKKEEKSFIRRKARNFTGLSFGYIYPVEGYDNVKQDFTIDGRTGFETENIATGMMMGYRKGFAINIYVNYLFSKTDFCPYLGGALGFHWINHDYRVKGYDEDGFEFIASTGIRLFRTYNFQILVNLDYTASLNDYNDNGIVLTLGLLK